MCQRPVPRFIICSTHYPIDTLGYLAKETNEGAKIIAASDSLARQPRISRPQLLAANLDIHAIRIR